MDLILQEKNVNGGESENKEAPPAETSEPKPESSGPEGAEVKNVTEDKAIVIEDKATVTEEKKEEATAAATTEKPEEADKKEEKKDAPAAASA